MKRSIMTQIETTDMTAMMTTTSSAGHDMDFSSAVKLMSITISLQLRPAGCAATLIFDFLVQFELHGEIEQNVDRLAVERAGLETPLSDCFDGRLVEAERQRLEHVHVDHF